MDERPRVAIVTGASQGLGLGIAQAYRARGWSVVGTSRTIAASGDPGFVTVAGDIGDPATAPRVIGAALDAFGRVDTLVNNAGIFIGGAFTELTEAQFRQVQSTNVDGFFHVTQAAVRAMLLQGDGGHVVQITTTLVEHAHSAIPSVLAALSKGGLAAATRSLAIEFAGRGIRANAVSPGVIRTPMHAPETHAALGALHPLGTTGAIEDVVRAILFLEDSPFVTGEILHVDGGWIAGH